jgi:phosphoribosylanthranilate isomerase
MTRPEDALSAVEAGATHLGLIFVPETPRYLSLEKARLISELVKGRVTLVGVFRNQPLAVIQRFIQDVPLDWAQLHGRETADACEAIPVPVIKTIEVDEQGRLSLDWREYEACKNVAALLLDLSKQATHLDRQAFVNAVKPVIRFSSKPCWIAGRLLPTTVDWAIHKLEPAGVDVAFGVENAPGIKDPEKMKLFCEAARQAAAVTS